MTFPSEKNNDGRLKQTLEKASLTNMTPNESKNDRDQRVAKLWETLDARKEGHIDLNGLRKGLKKIDHREPYRRT